MLYFLGRSKKSIVAGRPNFSVGENSSGQSTISSRRQLREVADVRHISPESYAGGPLALVKGGDTISLDVAYRKLELLMPAAELEERRRNWTKPERDATRGYLSLDAGRVTQAHLGCDFRLLADPEIHKLPRGQKGNRVSKLKKPPFAINELLAR